MANEQQAKHTPGPWQRSGVRVHLGVEDCLQVGPDGFAIAFLPIGARPMDQAGAIADANLIAAAPDLLRALKQCAAVCAGEVTNKNGLIAALEAAANAIRKATGA